MELITVCSHENEILDTHEGSYVCSDCGLVKDQFYEEKIFSMKEQASNYNLLTSGILTSVIFWIE